MVMLLTLSLLLSICFCYSYTTIRSSSSSHGIRSKYTSMFVNSAANTDITSNVDVNIGIDIKPSNNINEYIDNDNNDNNG